MSEAVFTDDNKIKRGFDNKYDRRGSWSLKYDFNLERGKPADALPLWVADMDFPCPEFVIKELVKVVEKGIFGYTEPKEDYYESVRKWFEKNYNWETKSEWIVKTPGVVFALAMAVKAFSKKDDYILIQTPVYYPFYEVITDNDRHVAASPLVLNGDRYEMDYEGMERMIKEKNIKLMFLCSPHNPVGRVWTKEELEKLSLLVKKYNLIIISDEIHCDLTIEGFRHRVLSEAVPDIAGQTVVCTSPAKTFNLAGLQISNIFIENEELRRKFVHQIDAAGYSQLSQTGLVACKAAYDGGEEWLKECRKYLQGNLDYIRDYVKENLPGVRLIEPEGTYFAWLDFRQMGLTARQLKDLVLNKAKLWLDDGYIFGREGEGFERLAYATDRATLKEALDRLKSAIRNEE